VIALPYELLRDEPSLFLGALEEQLGLDPGSRSVPERNVAIPRESLYWYPHLSRLVAAACRRVGGRVGDRLFAAYVAQIANDRLSGAARVGDRLLPSHEHDEMTVPPDLLEPFRGRATLLAERPFYDRYAAEYLNAGARN
jgi:hypothetical protein